MASQWSYVQESVKCGKAGCKKCPHGPYWYRYREVKGRTKKEYVGKDRWRFQADEDSSQQDHSNSHAGNSPKPDYTLFPKRWDDIFEKGKRSLHLAKEILGIDPYRPFDITILRSQVRKLLMLHHPDRGGNERAFKLVSAAWQYYQDVFKKD